MSKTFATSLLHILATMALTSLLCVLVFLSLANLPLTLTVASAKLALAMFFASALVVVVRKYFRETLG